MKHFLNSKNQLFAFEDDGSQDAYISEDMRPATDDEVQAIQNPQLDPVTIRESAIAEIRAQRAPILDALSGIAVDAFVSGDQATAEAVVSVRQQLKDLTILPAFLAATTYDGMKAAIMGRYREIAAAAPEAVQKAFREVL